jgi:hypothetical protein
MPFESWERLPGESGAAYAAFCAFRDFGLERNIRKAVEGQFRWQDRAADYDRYTEKLKQTELRKTIEAQAEKHRAVTGKMLEVVSKKLDLMNPADLTQGTVTEWVETAIKAEREAVQFADAKCSPKQGEINFTPEFNGL